MTKTGIKTLLDEIVRGDMECIYVHISEKAGEWALCGLMDEANLLLERLWKFQIPHSGNLWQMDDGFQVMWSLTGKQPAGIPFSQGDIERIDANNWSEMFGLEDPVARTLAGLQEQLPGLALNKLSERKTQGAYDRKSSLGTNLTNLRSFLNRDSCGGYPYFQASTHGALQAAKHDLTDEAADFIKLWGEGYLRFPQNYTIAALMRDRNTARMLLTGVLAPVFTLTRDRCVKETGEIIEALTKRIATGRHLLYGQLSWGELLDKISTLAIAENGVNFKESIVKSNSLSKPPATEEEISASERRLEVTFPDDYREFLQISNGFECISNIGVTILSVEKVDQLRVLEQQLVEIWTESIGEVDGDFCEKFKRSILIGGFGEEQQLLLIPPIENEKWECWFFSCWGAGETRYDGFRYYMEEELHRLEDGW